MKRVDEAIVDDNDAPQKKASSRNAFDVFNSRILDLRASIGCLQRFISKHQAQVLEFESELEEVYWAKQLQLEEKEKTYELMTHRIEATVLHDPINLNVGGRMFTVTSDMMTKYPNSFFSRLVSGRWEGKKTVDGAYFINRDFDHFHYIVSFLRNGGLNVDLSEVDHQSLCQEADYYQLPELVAAITSATWAFTASDKDHLKISKDRLTITKTSVFDHLLCTSTGTEGWVDGVHEWNIRIKGTSIVLGITTNLRINSRDNRVRLFVNNGMVDEIVQWNKVNTFSCFDVPITSGSLISVRLDMNNNTVIFGLNGVWSDVVVNISTGCWHPYIGISTQYDSVTIVR